MEGSISTGHITTSTYRPGRGGTVFSAGWRQYKDTLASQPTAPPVYTLAAPLRMVREKELAGQFSGSKRCRPQPVSSSCTSGRELCPFVEVTEPGRNSEMSIYKEKMTQSRTNVQRKAEYAMHLLPTYTHAVISSSWMQ